MYLYYMYTYSDTYGDVGAVALSESVSRVAEM